MTAPDPFAQERDLIAGCVGAFHGGLAAGQRYADDFIAAVRAQVAEEERRRLADFIRENALTITRFTRVPGGDPVGLIAYLIGDALAAGSVVPAEPETAPSCQWPFRGGCRAIKAAAEAGAAIARHEPAPSQPVTCEHGKTRAHRRRLSQSEFLNCPGPVVQQEDSE